MSFEYSCGSGSSAIMRSLLLCKGNGKTALNTVLPNEKLYIMFRWHFLTTPKEFVSLLQSIFRFPNRYSVPLPLEIYV